MFVSDPKRLIYRIIQTVVVSFIAFMFPAFADVISLDILLRRARGS